MNEKKSANWGGKRPGTGGVKPTLSPNEATVRATVTLPASMMEGIKTLGNGNVSLGVRRLYELMKANEA